MFGAKESPLCWLSLECGLRVFWNNSNTWLGFCLRSKGSLTNSEAKDTPAPMGLKETRMSQTGRRKANHAATYPGPCLE